MINIDSFENPEVNVNQVVNSIVQRAVKIKSNFFKDLVVSFVICAIMKHCDNQAWYTDKVLELMGIIEDKTFKYEIISYMKYQDFYVLVKDSIK